MTTKSTANAAHDAARAEDARRAHAELHAYITVLERDLSKRTRERDEAQRERDNARRMCDEAQREGRRVMTSEEIRRDAEKTARGFMGPLALLAPMTSDVLKTAIDTLADRIAAEREKVARLERERDALAAQLAALRAEVHDVLAEPHAYIGGRERSVLTCAVAAATAPAVEAQLAALREALGVVRGCYVALAGVDHGILAYVDEAIAKAPAPTVEAYTRRVQAEALESAATDLEAWGDPHAADAIAELRRRARELRGGR